MPVAVASSPSAVELVASSVRMRERVEREHDQDGEMKTRPNHLEFELVVEWLERSLRHLINEAKQNHSRSKRKHSEATYFQDQDGVSCSKNSRHQEVELRSVQVFRSQ